MGYATKRVKVRRHNHFMKLSATVALAGVDIVPLAHPNGETMNIYAISGLDPQNKSLSYHNDWFRTYWGREAAVRYAAKKLQEF